MQSKSKSKKEENPKTNKESKYNHYKKRNNVDYKNNECCRRETERRVIALLFQGYATGLDGFQLKRQTNRGFDGKLSGDERSKFVQASIWNRGSAIANWKYIGRISGGRTVEAGNSEGVTIPPIKAHRRCDGM